MLSADVAFMDVACEPIQSGCFEYILVLHYGRFIHVHCVVHAVVCCGWLLVKLDNECLARAVE